MSKEERDTFSGNTDSNFERIFESTSKLKVPSSNIGKEVAWDKLMQSIERQDTKPKVVSISPRTIWISIAATLLVLFTITTLTYQYAKIEIISPKGNFANIVLPDSSEVKLNADSRIEYRRFGWSSNRELTLIGEAFFNVRHGNRFTVLTEFNRKIIVTGTKFNVFARGFLFEVKCFEGSVNVETPKSKPIAVGKGKGISFSKAEELPQQFDIDSAAVPKWINGEFFFHNLSLNYVFDELNRQFNISILPIGFNPETRNYTGFFKHKNLIQALDLVCIPMDLIYQISSDSTSVRIIKK